MAKTPDTFKSYVSRERSRLTRARDAALNRKNRLEQELSEIESELNAIQAYEKAKQGASAKAGRTAGRRPAPRSGGRAPRGEKRRAVLELIQKSDGLTRGEILANLGVKGDKSAEQSVSNALTALKKQNVVTTKDRKYIKA